MIVPVTSENYPLFRQACAYERIFGSKCLCSYDCFADSGAYSFWLGLAGSHPACAMQLSGGVLSCSSDGSLPPRELADFIRAHGVTELDSNEVECRAVQAILGGALDSSHYMYYEERSCEDAPFPVEPCRDLHDAFSVLQRSHEFYRTHYRFEPWAADLSARLSGGSAELYTVELDGSLIGTGSIISMDETVGVLAAIAVVPEYRHRGIGLGISRFLTRRVLSLGKKPCLIAGYDEVMALYRLVGYTPGARWGELYP